MNETTWLEALKDTTSVHERVDLISKIDCPISIIGMMVKHILLKNNTIFNTYKTS